MDQVEAQGRMVGAARVLAGLSQTDLAHATGLSATTVSNVEAGRVAARPSTMKLLRRALKGRGVTLTHDVGNGTIMLATNYDPDA